MLQHVLFFVGGLVLLLVGGRLLVSASVDTARRLSVSPLVVGLTLVAWGTSAPELALNLISAFKGRGDLAVGNLIGANICNIALVLGACAVLTPLVVQERLIRVEIWLNAVVLSALAALGLLGDLQRWNAAMMLLVFVVYSALTIRAALRESWQSAGSVTTHAPDPDVAPEGPPMGWILIAVCFAGGLAMLSFGGSLASDGASGIAIALGVAPGVVGVTVVAVGTTLPELITGVLAVRKGQTDLAMGNVLGSCLFNAGAIYGLAGLVAPPQSSDVLNLPLAFMAALSLVLIPISRTHERRVARIEGVGLLAIYAAFIAVSAWRNLPA